jgi:3-hydroxyacyl-[acyl-carrier-protein] dehydratase
MGELNINQIKNLLPHRYPFLLVDKVISYEPLKSLVALKNITMNEPSFIGHFPAMPIMPGVLVTEAMAQAAALLGCVSIEKPSEGALYYLVGIDNARFKKPVIPGDQLIINAIFVKERRNIWKFKTTATVNDVLVASADIMTTVKDPDL